MDMNMEIKTVFVTGGAGYVGSALVPKLLAKGCRVKVLDLYWFGDQVFDSIRDDPSLVEIKGDIRDRDLLQKELPGTDAVIHLACISNDPSYELNPQLSKTINYDAFLPLVALSQKAGVKRFIYASSSSVYGIKSEPEVTEDLPLEPLTDYSKYKALCEKRLLEAAADDFTATIVRPATGGEQKRPNLHIDDMANLYLFLLEQSAEKIHRQIYNVGYENYRVREIAEMVRDTLGGEIPIETVATDDNRSYHVSSRKIFEELGFKANHSVEAAIRDLKTAFNADQVPNPMTDPQYFNIKRMQSLNLV